MKFTSRDFAMLRMTINELMPDRPALGATFSDTDVEILLRAGFKCAAHFQTTTEEALMKLHIRLARIWSLRPGGSGRPLSLALLTVLDVYTFLRLDVYL